MVFLVEFLVVCLVVSIDVSVAYAEVLRIAVVGSHPTLDLALALDADGSHLGLPETADAFHLTQNNYVSAETVGNYYGAWKDDAVFVEPGSEESTPSRDSIGMTRAVPEAKWILSGRRYLTVERVVQVPSARVGTVISVSVF